MTELELEVARLREWKAAVLGKIKRIPEYTTGEWGAPNDGSKEGWGFCFELIGWQTREVEKLRANLDRCFGSGPSAYMEMTQKLVEADAEIKKLRTFVQGVREFDPRSDIYANELHGDACEVLGLCRCCGQEVCDDA